MFFSKFCAISLDKRLDFPSKFGDLALENHQNGDQRKEIVQNHMAEPSKKHFYLDEDSHWRAKYCQVHQGK